MAQDIVSKIQAAAQASGVDPGVALRIAGVESSMNPRAKNPKSSAKGLFQVTNDTWKDYGGKPGLQKNTDENIRVGMKILSSNKDSMQKFLGREPLPSDIYAAHFFGPTGARSVMSGDPLAQVSSLVSKEVMKANPQLAGKTANEVLTGFKQKFDGAAKRYPTSEPMKTTTAVQGPRATQPKMGQEAGAAAPALSARNRIAGMGANYQAALAAMMLGEAADEGEDDGVAAKEPKEKAYVAPVAKNALADMDFGPSSSPFDAMEPAVTPPGMKFPMQFAEGGDVADPEAALLAGASDAPAPRVGTAAAALAALRGLGEYPYNLVGGGVDLATMAMRPFGYDVEKPVMGSDFLKEQATRFGIRPPEETDPTLRNIRMGTEIVTSVLDPSAGARAVGSALRGAGDLATSEPARVMLERVMKAGGTEPMYAVRPPGGYMLQQPAEVVGALSRPVDNPLGGVDKMMNNAYKKLTMRPGDTEQITAVSNFLMKQGRQYFSKNYASTSDPLYTALKDGRVLPLKSDERNLRGYMIKAGREGDPDALEDMARTYDGGLQSYSLAGDSMKTDAMKQSLLERTRAAGEKAGLTPGEATNSNMMYDANYFPNMKEALEQGVPEVMQAKKYDDPVFDVVDYRIPQFMNPEKMVDELLQIPADKLENMSYPEAVIAANKNMRFMEDFEAAAARVKQGKPVPKQVMLFGTEKFDTASKNELLSWYKFNDSKAALMEGNAMGHSIGGYNRYGTYNEGGKAAFDAGKVEIYSLRDQKGMPSATVELVTRKNDEGTPMRLVTDIRGIYNSRPLSDGDIFSLFDKIKPDGFANRTTNGPAWFYFEDNLNQPIDRVDVNYKEAYEAYKKGDAQGFASGGLVERSVYNHQKYL